MLNFGCDVIYGKGHEFPNIDLCQENDIRREIDLGKSFAHSNNVFINKKNKEYNCFSKTLALKTDKSLVSSINFSKSVEVSNDINNIENLSPLSISRLSNEYETELHSPISLCRFSQDNDSFIVFNKKEPKNEI